MMEGGRKGREGRERGGMSRRQIRRQKKTNKGEGDETYGEIRW